MEDRWFVESVEIRGGFLQELELQLPIGLTCIIGPRGSGKSTLAEALRLGVTGLTNASRLRLELYRCNLAKSVVTVRTRPTPDGKAYVIRREGGESAILTTNDGRALPSVDLDRGTFLPLDGYSSFEIEEMAEERLGAKRRSLLDELRPAEMQQAQDQVAAARRELEANADGVRATQRDIESLNEKIQVYGDARDRLAALAPASAPTDDTVALQTAARQDQLNKAEVAGVDALQPALKQFSSEVNELAVSFRERVAKPLADPRSKNAEITTLVDHEMTLLVESVREHCEHIRRATELTKTRLSPLAERLKEDHLQQEAAYSALREKNLAASQAIRERADAEEVVRRLEGLESQKAEAVAVRTGLLDARKSLRGKYIGLREKVSELRQEVARELECKAGEQVRVRVRRNADMLEYQQKIGEGLHGAGVRNHDRIVECVSRMRPDELAQIIHERDYTEFESVCGLGDDRSRRVLDSFRSSFDPLELESMRLEDVISIELNVGSDNRQFYKDASELSRGQKCTALLPLLLARRHTPLVIDQPEDNLDNHFIFRTVVESIRRLKASRQMVFITHNANIPVLAEAELIVVMGSDGKTGHVEKQGTLDECQQEIIDLLEGGKEAFDKRRQRYERR